MAEAGDWFASVHIPLQPWIDSHFFWLSQHVRPYFDILRGPLAAAIGALATFLGSIPPPLVLLVLFVATWQAGGLVSGIFVAAVLGLAGTLGIWADMAQTFALILTSVVLCLLVGLPLGFAAARSNRIDTALRPVLDLMQTLPAFVYLVPIVLVVGIGSVPGILVTFVFAVPPTIRLTSLALRNVPPPIVEAAQALGASPAQILFKVEIPNALGTMLLGINQTVMMALAMVTYAAMIGVGGLGRLVLQGIGRLDMGLATVGGLGIVALAILFSQLLVAKPRNVAGPAWLASPSALVVKLFRALAPGPTRRLAAPATTIHGDENHA
jgi:glycine betaine/proline transport system permease protein